MHISRIAARVEQTTRRVLGTPPAPPAESPVLADIRAGESRRIAAERADRQAAAVRSKASTIIDANGRVIHNDGSPIPQPAPGPYLDWLRLEDQNADSVPGGFRFGADGGLHRSGS